MRTYNFPPVGAPLNIHRDEQWRSSSSTTTTTPTNFDNSVNAVSFGFVATAILISMFLIMAIFERFVSPRSPTTDARDNTNIEPQQSGFDRNKFCYASPKMTVSSNEVSVLMPGDDVPTFIAQPAPVPRHTKPLSHDCATEQV